MCWPRIVPSETSASEISSNLRYCQRMRAVASGVFGIPLILFENIVAEKYHYSDVSTSCVLSHTFFVGFHSNLNRPNSTIYRWGFIYFATTASPTQLCAFERIHSLLFYLFLILLVPRPLHPYSLRHLSTSEYPQSFCCSLSSFKSNRRNVAYANHCLPSLLLILVVPYTHHCLSLSFLPSL